MASPGGRWEGRPRRAFLIRLVALLIPVLAAVAAATVASRLLPRPKGGAGTVLWWLAAVMASTLTLVVVDRQARRLLPLAALLKLTLVFPDRAPSRLGVALRAGTVRNLEERLEQGRRHGVGDDPTQAAAGILVLAAALARHDRRTRGHSERVRGFTDLIAEEMHLTGDERDRLRWAALLHDVGKVQVRPEILNKQGSLTAEEWEAIHRHPLDGARITAALRPWLGGWGDAVEQHHERWDGEGYPHGLAGDEIALAARIVAVADAFEVMTAARSYHRPLGAAAARDELARCAGSHFDPMVVRAFLNVSIGRLRRVLAPVTWLADLPVVRPVANAGGTAAESAGAAAVAKTFAAVSLAFFGGTAAGPPPASPAVVGGPAEQQPERRAQTPEAGTSRPPGGATGQSPSVALPPSVGTTVAPPPARPGAPLARAAAGSPSGQPRARPRGGPPTGNQPPVAGADAATVAEDRSVRIDVLANDSDPDGLEWRTLAVVGGPTHGEARVPAGKDHIRYEAPDDYAGPDAFQYRICDSKGACSVASVHVTVVPD